MEEGTKWQNNNNWGNLYVTTLATYEGNANLQNALIHSDNIYFAKSSFKDWKNKFEKGIRRIWI